MFNGLRRYFVEMPKRAEAREEARWLKRNTWNGLVPGDTVMYKQRRLMYVSLSDDEAISWPSPGRSIGREPVFAEPGTNPLCIYYIRTATTANDLPPVFRESAPPVQIEDTGLVVKFLNPEVEQISRLFRKTGHLVPEEWPELRPCEEPIRK